MAIAKHSATHEMEPGIKTSEFWLNALLIAGTVVLMLTGSLSVEDIKDLWPLYAGGGLYSLARGLRKGASGR